MPLTGEDADTRYVHLLGQVGVHLMVKCPDCKRELMLMSQITSVQCAQDKDQACSLEESEEIDLRRTTTEAESPDTFDLQSHLSDNTKELERKRLERRQLENKRRDARLAQAKKEREQAANTKDENERKQRFASFYVDNYKPNDNKTAERDSPTDGSCTIDPTEQPVTENPKRKIEFALKPPPPKKRTMLPNRQGKRLTLETVETKHPDDSISPLSK